ncbi:hypothetical protein QFZ79_001768 [Arthrobacter sp. V4I6]|nr:hypothetical protein [Arthrobacter sp. V1I7]MDQ0853657.1 hypothetical protein [Arthrobacter sp. V4I6]
MMLPEIARHGSRGQHGHQQSAAGPALQRELLGVVEFHEGEPAVLFNISRLRGSESVRRYGGGIHSRPASGPAGFRRSANRLA